MSNITVFSPNLVGGSRCNGPRGTYARIGWDTFTRDAELSVSSEREGFPGESLRNATTYDRWSPVATPAWAQFDAGENVDIDYVGVASHNLASVGAQIAVQYSQDAVEWSNAIVLTPSRDDALLAWFEPVTARYWRLLIQNGIQPSVGVVYLGQILVMPRAVTGGHTPGALARQTEIMPSKSDSGQFLGRSVIRHGYATTYRWESLAAQWYRDQFDRFAQSAVKYPFFLTGNPARWPDEVLYAWATKDIQPRYMQQRDWMSVELPLEAIA